MRRSSMVAAACVLRASAISNIHTSFPFSSFLLKHPVLGSRRLRRTCFALSCFSTYAPRLSHLQLELTQVLVNGRELAVVQPSDVDKVLDMYIEQGRLEGDPYWCRIWPSAIALAEEMLKSSQLVANLHVCDLGSGLGLAGVSALLAGARQVVFYDQEPLALFCSLLTVHVNMPNATTNLPLFTHQLFADSSSEQIEALAYGLALSPEIFQPRNGCSSMDLMARAEVFNWSRKEMHTLCFDTVLACDVLYEKESVLNIAAILPSLIPRGSGKVIMADPTNRTPQNRKEFLRLLDSNGCKGLKLERMEKVKLQLNEKIEDVELMQFDSTEWAEENSTYLYACGN